MYKTILVATDGSELAAKGVCTAFELARAFGATVVAVTVTDMIPTGFYGAVPSPELVERYETAAEKAAAAILRSVADAARTLGVPCTVKHVPGRRPAEGISEAAAEQRCDLIVMASHGRDGVSRLLLGGQALEVLTLSNVPVMIVR